MKKLMMVMALMVAAVTANAQQMFLKPMVGATLATLTKIEHSQLRPGIAAGGEFGYLMNEQFGVTAGALVSMQGCNLDYDGYDTAYSSFTYLNVPVLANYYIIPGLAVKAGIQPGFLLSRKSKFEYSGHESENTDKDGFNTLDLSIPIGASYEFGDFVIDARYNLGLSCIYNSDYDGDDKPKHSVIMLTLGYKIPF